MSSSSGKMTDQGPLPDLSSFYLANEEVARELGRVVGTGALDELIRLLGAAGLELRIESVREEEGLRELLGRLGPRRHVAGSALPVVVDQREDAELGEVGRAWDPSESLATRSRFVVDRGAGPEELVMPDHVCPFCLNDRENVIESCARVCDACERRW